jgi:hypothetical protein
MKSFFSVAPELPPPPYTWLMTTVGGFTAEASGMRKRTETNAQSTAAVTTEEKRFLGIGGASMVGKPAFDK